MTYDGGGGSEWVCVIIKLLMAYFAMRKCLAGLLLSYALVI